MLLFEMYNMQYASSCLSRFHFLCELSLDCYRHCLFSMKAESGPARMEWIVDILSGNPEDNGRYNSQKLHLYPVACCSSWVVQEKQVFATWKAPAALLLPPCFIKHSLNYPLVYFCLTNSLE